MDINRVKELVRLEATTRPFNGTRDVFYVQILDHAHRVVTNVEYGRTSPTPDAMECMLIAATAVYGHDLQAKVDKRTVLNYID